jgi:hypothetical protein
MAGVSKTKRPYRKSTPIGRLRRNADKVSKHASLLWSRVSSWGAVDDERVVTVEKMSSSIMSTSLEVDALLATLEDSGFVPPEKPRTVTWSRGQVVAVARKFRPKYEEAFRDDLRRDSGYLDGLVVVDVLTSGEVVVRRKTRSSFLLPKTHLVEVVEESGG